MSTANTTRVGISTATFFPMDTSEALTLCCELGFRKLEVFLNTLEETGQDYIQKLKQTAEKYGADIISVHPYLSGFEYMLFFSAYKARLEDSIKLYRNFFEAAAKLNAQYVVLHGDRIGPAALSPEEYLRVFTCISGAAEDSGVVLTQENVSWCSSGNPDFIRRLRELSGDSIKFTYDYKQAVRAGVDAYDMIDAMGDRIVNVHINSCDNNGCHLPFVGEKSTAEVMDKIISYNYIGSFLIEVYRENFTDNIQLTNSYDLCEKYIKSITK